MAIGPQGMMAGPQAAPQGAQLMQLMQRLRPAPAGKEDEQLRQIRLQLGQLASQIGGKSYKAAQKLFQALQDLEQAEQELKQVFAGQVTPLPQMGPSPGQSPGMMGG